MKKYINKKFKKLNDMEILNTILQNMYNFNEPRIALVSRKDEKGCYNFIELSGYIVEMVYNEYGALLKSRTFFIDKSETVNPNIEKVIEYIPRTLTLGQVVDILDRLYQVADGNIKELESLSGYQICSSEVCELLKIKFNINFEFSRDLYYGNTLLKYELNIFTYEKYYSVEIETEDFDHSISEIKFSGNNFFNLNLGKYDIFVQDIIEKLKSRIDKRREIFGFLHKYEITCTSVRLLEDERDEKIMKLINEKLKKEE